MRLRLGTGLVSPGDGTSDGAIVCAAVVGPGDVRFVSPCLEFGIPVGRAPTRLPTIATLFFSRPSLFSTPSRVTFSRSWEFNEEPKWLFEASPGLSHTNHIRGDITLSSHRRSKLLAYIWLSARIFARVIESNIARRQLTKNPADGSAKGPRSNFKHQRADDRARSWYG